MDDVPVGRRGPVGARRPGQHGGRGREHRGPRAALSRDRDRADGSDRLLALAAPERGRIGPGGGRVLVLDAACLPGGGARVRCRARPTVEPRARAGDAPCRGICGADACGGARRAGERPERGGEPGRRHPRGARAAHGSRDGGRSRVVRARERRRARARRAGGERARLRRGPEPAGVERELASGRERARAQAGVDRDGGGLVSVRRRPVVARSGHRRSRRRAAVRRSPARGRPRRRLRLER